MSENDWRYVQHRGGATGFLGALNPSLLASAAYKGNRQLLEAKYLGSLSDLLERRDVQIANCSRMERH